MHRSCMIVGCCGRRMLPQKETGPNRSDLRRRSWRSKRQRCGRCVTSSRLRVPGESWDHMRAADHPRSVLFDQRLRCFLSKDKRVRRAVGRGHTPFHRNIRQRLLGQPTLSAWSRFGKPYRKCPLSMVLDGKGAVNEEEGGCGIRHSPRGDQNGAAGTRPR